MATLDSRSFAWPQPSRLTPGRVSRGRGLLGGLPFGMCLVKQAHSKWRCINRRRTKMQDVNTQSELHSHYSSGGLPPTNSEPIGPRGLEPAVQAQPTETLKD